jgi:hypothetical protein
MKRIKDVLLIVLFATVLGSVVVLHFGCDDPTGPDANCGPGPFTYDSKTGICKDLSTNYRVNPDCCNR